jgi:hypothetical protein
MREGLIRLNPAGADEQFRVEWIEGPPGSPGAVAAHDTRSWSADRFPPLSAVPAAFASRDTSDDRLEQLGRALHDFLLGGAAGAARKVALEGSPDRLRTWLQIPASLAPVPWELMRDRLHDPVFCAGNAPWVRWTRAMPTPHNRPAGWPIRVLLAVAQGPDKDTLAAVQEVEAVEDILWHYRRDFDLHVLPAALEPDALREAARDFKPHVIHVIAHGTTMDNEFAIAFPGNAGHAMEWRARDVAGDFRGDSLLVPYLVVLNACRSAPGQLDGIPYDEHGIWSVAGAFLERGVDAVVSMQGDVQGEAAARFSRVFYEQLARGEPVDVAAARGRDIIRQKFPGPRQAALPVIAAGPLHRHLQRPARERTVIQRIETTTEFSFICHRFVDREAERRTILRRVCPESSKEDRRSLIVLYGPQDAGKRFLATTILELLASRGSQVRRVPVHRRLAGLGASDISWPRVLVELRSGRPATPAAAPSWLEESLPGEAFRGFDFDLQQLCQNPHQAPPPAPSDLSRVPSIRDIRWPSPAEMSEGFISYVFESFRDALQEAAEHEPLVIVFDELTDYTTHLANPAAGHTPVEPPVWWQPFVSGLFRPAAEGKIPGLTTLLLMRDAERETLKPGTLNPGVAEIPLPMVPAGQCYRLARQLYRRLCPEHWADPQKTSDAVRYLERFKQGAEAQPVVGIWNLLRAVFAMVEWPGKCPNPFELREPDLLP